MLPSRTAADWIYEDDASLMARVREGEHAAFAALVRRHTGRFYRVAYRFMRSPAESEDVVQDAFVKLWEKPDMWQAERNVAFTTWFHRVVVNRCLDQHKKKRPLHLVDDTLVADDRESQEDSLMAGEQQTQLETLIGELPERQRTALNLCFYEGLSNQEAAEIMGVRLKALQSLLMRAKTTLKDRMKGH